MLLPQKISSLCQSVRWCLQSCSVYQYYDGPSLSLFARTAQDLVQLLSTSYHIHIIFISYIDSSSNTCFELSEQRRIPTHSVQFQLDDCSLSAAQYFRTYFLHFTLKWYMLLFPFLKKWGESELFFNLKASFPKEDLQVTNLNFGMILNALAYTLGHGRWLCFKSTGCPTYTGMSTPSSL